MALVKQFKAYSFEPVLRDAALVCSSARENFSANMWDRCQFNIELIWESLIFSSNSECINLNISGENEVSITNNP